MTEQPIRLVIADDHPVFRDGLASLLDPLEEIDVVARARDGEEAVAAVREHAPDVVIMDVQMPALNGIEATRQVVAERPGTTWSTISQSAFSQSARVGLATFTLLRPNSIA